MTNRFTLGKNERLKSRKLIEQLFREGKSFVVFPYKIYYLVTAAANIQQSIFHIQFGVGVSKKVFRKAVNRNRVKRLIREAYRLQKNELENLLRDNQLQLNIFFTYNTKELSDFNSVKEKVNVILNKLVKIINEKISSNT